jgi:DNA polymerase-3 subunit delta'
LTRFEDLIGQELASRVLQRAIREDRTCHAYLFTGPEGVGKLTTALAFAAALNCENRTESGDACGECVQCRMIGGNGHPDVEVISPDGAETKMKQVQSMRHASQYAPMRGKWKVTIIEQADTLNEDSSSCILKTLEEPPAYLVIILLSRNPALILQTIRSRCLQIRFAGVSPIELKNALIERFDTDPEQAEFLAAYSEGMPGKAISILGSESFTDWRQKVIDLAGRITSHDQRYALRLSEELQDVVDEGKEMGKSQRAAMNETLSTLILWYRDILNLSIRGKSANLINSDLCDTLATVRMDAGSALAAIETLLWAKRAVEGNANVQLISDVTMMRLLRRQ